MFNKRPILETARLWIIPLTHNQLINYLQANGSLEEELGVKPIKRHISVELIEAFEKAIMPSVGDPSKNYLFSTLWTIIDKEKLVMVGDICFKGEANAEGEVEIGYGTHVQFRRSGYMAEAVGAICKWVFEFVEVRSINAETNSNNIASEKVLRKNGFVAFKNDNNNTWWHLQKIEKLAIERA